MSRHKSIINEAPSDPVRNRCCNRTPERSVRGAVDGCGRAPKSASRADQHGLTTFKALLALIAIGVVLGPGLAFHGQGPAAVKAAESPPGYSLNSIAVPGPPPEVLAEFVADKAAAIQLGKALFWETRVGSDNKTACASCHFNAGADSRITNQLNPGRLGGGKVFQLGGINHTLVADELPFTKHVVAGSQGVFLAKFSSSGGRGAVDTCAGAVDSVFHGLSANGGVNTRQTTGRNSPSVINAVFNFRNFWDGRGNNVFNGGDPFGMRNPNALVWKMTDGVLSRTEIAIPSSSLASQGSGPPLSEVEMSCSDRSFMKLGRKLLPLVPLARQVIAKDDSVLAKPSVSKQTYAGLIKVAFRKPYWASPKVVELSEVDEMRFASMDLHPRRSARPKSKFKVSQMEANFALFFGLAIQMYEATLIAGDTPFDRYLEGDAGALSAQQIRGFEVFDGPGKCSSCHSGIELTAASFANVTNERLERMLMGNNEEAVYDNGFYNIGVRPTAEDIGVGGTDPFGQPLSETRMVQIGKASLLGNGFDADKEPTVGPEQRVAVDGAFKTPGLRNVEFTGPYFHNGGMATLMQVVDFYNRGGDFAEVNQENLDPDIQPLGLSESQKRDLVAFMLALSDDRVRYKKAPFDHPSICIVHGHPEVASLIADGTTGNATDAMQCIRQVGAGGSRSGLPTFLNLSPFKH